MSSVQHSTIQFPNFPLSAIARLKCEGHQTTGADVALLFCKLWKKSTKMIQVQIQVMRLSKAVLDTISFICNSEHPDMYINSNYVVKFGASSEGRYKKVYWLQCLQEICSYYVTETLQNFIDGNKDKKCEIGRTNKIFGAKNICHDFSFKPMKPNKCKTLSSLNGCLSWGEKVSYGQPTRNIPGKMIFTRRNLHQSILYELISNCNKKLILPSLLQLCRRLLLATWDKTEDIFARVIG